MHCLNLHPSLNKTLCCSVVKKLEVGSQESEERSGNRQSISQELNGLATVDYNTSLTLVFIYLPEINVVKVTNFRL